jgi:tetratricopeptide (TPR) repeat protein
VKHQSIYSYNSTNFLGVIVAVAIAVLVLTAGCDRPKAFVSVLDEARSAYAKGHFTEAERFYERYLQTEPSGENRWEAWSRLLDIARGVLSDYERAGALLDSMFLEFGEEPGKAWDLLSAAASNHEAMRRWPEAINAWKRCIELTAKEPERLAQAHRRLALLYRGQREYDAAGKSLKMCLKLSASPLLQAECQLDLAQTLDYEHKRAQAQSVEGADGKKSYDPIPNLEQIKKLLEDLLNEQRLENEQQALAMLLLAETYESLGNKSQAEKVLRSLLPLYPNPKVVEIRLQQVRKTKQAPLSPPPAAEVKVDDKKGRKSKRSKE